MKSLSKEVNGSKVTATLLQHNTYKFIADGGVFGTGKTGYYSPGRAISTASASSNELIVTKADIKRSGTYMIYLNGERFSFTGEWTDQDGNVVHVLYPPERFFYYFFK